MLRLKKKQTIHGEQTAPEEEKKPKVRGPGGEVEWSIPMGHAPWVEERDLSEDWITKPLVSDLLLTWERKIPIPQTPKQTYHNVLSKTPQRGEGPCTHDPDKKGRKKLGWELRLGWGREDDSTRLKKFIAQECCVIGHRYPKNTTSWGKCTGNVGLGIIIFKKK